MTPGAPVPHEQPKAAAGGELGAKVRALRRWRGLIQEQLAEKAGLSPMVVRKLEQGGGGVRLETLHRLAGALDAEVVFATQDPSPCPQADREALAVVRHLDRIAADVGALRTALRRLRRRL